MLIVIRKIVTTQNIANEKSFFVRKDVKRKRKFTVKKLTNTIFRSFYQPTNSLSHVFHIIHEIIFVLKHFRNNKCCHDLSFEEDFFTSYSSN